MRFSYDKTYLESLCFLELLRTTYYALESERQKSSAALKTQWGEIISNDVCFVKSEISLVKFMQLQFHEVFMEKFKQNIMKLILA